MEYESSLGLCPAPNQHSRKLYKRYAPATLRNLIAVFLADDFEVPRLLPVAIESIRKDQPVANGKGRRSIPTSIWRDITKARSSMPSRLFDFFSRCLKGEMGLPSDPAQFRQQRKELMTDLQSCPTSTCGLTLLQLIQQRINPLDGFPPVATVHTRTWFRLANRPDAIIRLVLPSIQSSSEDIGEVESCGVSFESLSSNRDDEPRQQSVCAAVDDRIICASERSKPLSLATVEVDISANLEEGELGDTAEAVELVCELRREPQTPEDAQTSPANSVPASGGEPISTNEDSQCLSLPMASVQDAVKRPIPTSVDDVIMDHELSFQLMKPSEDGVFDEILDDGDKSESNDPNFNLKRNNGDTEPIPESLLESIASVPETPSRHDSSDPDDLPDKDFSDSEMSLDLDGLQPIVASKSSALSSQSIPSAAKHTTDDSSAARVSLQEIASELRMERTNTLSDAEQTSVADFTKAFADVTKPSPRKRKGAQRTKAKTPAAKRARPQFNRPAQKFSTPCQFWVEMRCAKGDQCPFSHDVAQVKRAETCRYFMMGSCLKGEDCSHSHQVPCKFFHLQNACREVECRFSHDPMTEEESSTFRIRVEQGYYLRPEKCAADDAHESAVENPFLT